ncbi:MAG: hypothetical protein ACLFQH_08820 [Halothiobacillaceae bacterium]
MWIPALSAVLALCLPWLAGSLLVASLVRGLASRSLPLVLGYGYLVGFSLAVGLLWGFAKLFGSFSTGWVMLAMALASMVLAGLLVRRQDGPGPFLRAARGLAAMRLARWWMVALVMLLLALLALRWLGLVVDVSLRPVFAWDAFTAWTLKAHSLFETGQLLDFVAPGDWLEAPTDPSVRHALGAHYPLFVSLVQVWMASAMGQWHEAWVNLPWPMLLLSMMLVVYGQLRVAGVGVLGGLLGAYVLASLPLLGTHALLGGYADLWLAGVFGAATLALWQALFGADRAQYILLALVSPLLLVTKNINPTTMVLLMWVPLLWMAWAIHRPLVAGVTAGMALSALLGWLVLGGMEMVFGTRFDAHLPALENLLPALGVLYHGAFAHANWHLLAVAMLLALMVSIRLWVCRRDPAATRIGALGIFVIAALSIYVLVFSMPVVHVHIVNFTLAQRALLYIAMPVVVWCILALHVGLMASDWAGRISVRRASKVRGAI